MSLDFTPEAKAKWVLNTLSIFDTPAFHLDEIASSQKIKIGRRYFIQVKKIGRASCRERV